MIFSDEKKIILALNLLKKNYVYRLSKKSKPDHPEKLLQIRFLKGNDSIAGRILQSGLSLFLFQVLLLRLI